MPTTPPREISRAQLFDLVWQKPLADVAPRFGLSSSGLAKLCDRLDIPRPSRLYWVRRDNDEHKRPELPAVRDGVPSNVMVGGGAVSAQRRPRTRLSPEERRSHLLDTGARIALHSGIQKVTLKNVAREAGISEAQAHNCFEGRTDLLLALARREIEEVEALRVNRVSRGRDRFSQVVISTVSYLREAAQRGPLLQILLRVPQVRTGLKAERAERAERVRRPVLDAWERDEGVPRWVTNAATAALTAVTLRTGGMVATGRVDAGMAERLCLSVVMAGTVGIKRHGRRQD